MCLHKCNGLASECFRIRMQQLILLGGDCCIVKVTNIKSVLVLSYVNFAVLG